MIAQFSQDLTPQSSVSLQKRRLINVASFESTSYSCKLQSGERLAFLSASGLFPKTRNAEIFICQNYRDDRRSYLASLEEVDYDLFRALDLASDDELREICDILYGTSLFSPVMKSLTSGDGEEEPIEDVIFQALDLRRPEARSILLRKIQKRFLYLAADSRYIFRGYRPTYHSVLLSVREKLKVKCSKQLSVEDLEAEIFMHLLDKYSENESGLNPNASSDSKYRVAENEPMKVSSGKFRGAIQAALNMAKEEIVETLLKGSSAVTASAIQEMALKKLAAKFLMEKARYNVARELLKQGGKVVASKLETQLAFLTAQQGMKGAAAKFAGAQSLSLLIGPILWGHFLADMVIRSIGTDYARIVKAIFAIAQIRLTRTYGWTDGSSSGPKL